MSGATEQFIHRIDREGATAVLHPEGELDLNTSPELKEKGTGLIEQGVRLLALDLEKVSFMDSTGLGALVVLLKRVRDKDGKLCLFAANERVVALLSMTGLDAVFHSEPDEAAAREYLAG